MSGCSHPGIVLGMDRVFGRLSRMLVSCQMIPFSVFLTNAMSMGADFLQFGGSLMVLVMRSVVVASGHTVFLSHDLSC